MVMVEISKKSSTVIASSCGTIYLYSLGCPSLGNSAISDDEQASLSKNLSLKMAVPFKQSLSFKQMSGQLQDQESSSTQSTGQSYSEVPTIGPNIQQVRAGILAKTEAQVESAMSMISQDSIFAPPQLDYRQSLVCVPLPNSEPYLGSFGATSQPPTMISHTQLMGLATSRVPLPFDPIRDEPIYVNPKQYHGILRRRQQRAKLEAQNKLSRDRKPYLHESRHLHAVRRVRGSGGRFVSAKKLEESKLNSSTSCSDGHRSENYRDGSSTTSCSCSDVTSVSNGEIMFPQPNLKFSHYSSYVDGNHHKWSV